MKQQNLVAIDKPVVVKEKLPVEDQQSQLKKNVEELREKIVFEKTKLREKESLDKDVHDR